MRLPLEAGALLLKITHTGKTIHKVSRSLVPELDRSSDEDGTVVMELSSLLALDISGLASDVDKHTGDDDEDSVTARGGGGGRISPATIIAICMISLCVSLAGTSPMSCIPVDDGGGDVEETGVSSTIIGASEC